jgi:hypothetical protein
MIPFPNNASSRPILPYAGYGNTATAVNIQGNNGVAYDTPTVQNPGSTTASFDTNNAMPVIVTMLRTCIMIMMNQIMANGGGGFTNTLPTNTPQPDQTANTTNNNPCGNKTTDNTNTDDTTEATNTGTDTTAAATTDDTSATDPSDTVDTTTTTTGSGTTVASDKVGASKTAAKQPKNSINVKELGAKGDGKTDDQAVIQKALDSAKPGQTVWLPEGQFNHSGVLKVPSGVTLAGAGAGTVLKATDPNNAAVELTGSKSGLNNVTVMSNSDQRIPHAEASTVWVNHADGATVSNVTSVGSGANSVTIDRSNNSVIDHVLGVGSNADGIAINNGSQNNVIKNSVVRDCGDDSFSDDSYLNDEVASSGNQFLNNLSVNNRYGDNYKLAGASNDILDGNVSIGGPKGGIVVIKDTDSGTKASTGNTIKNSIAIDLPAPDASAFMVEGQTASNNVYYTKDAAEAKKYLAMADETAGDYDYNKNYKAGTGPGANNRNGNHLYP